MRRGRGLSRRICWHYSIERRRGAARKRRRRAAATEPGSISRLSCGRCGTRAVDLATRSPSSILEPIKTPRPKRSSRRSPRRGAGPPALTGAFFERAQVPMAIVCLEEPDKPASLRIVAINPAAAQVSDVPTAALGKRLDQDFPEIAKTRFPELVVQVLRTGVAKDLGEGPGVYSPDRAFTVKAFPIPPNCVGLVFEDVKIGRASCRERV